MSVPANGAGDPANHGVGKAALPPRQATEHAAAHGGGPLAALSLAALGVVYGDIGTSPIDALCESLHGAHGVAAPRRTCSGCCR